MAMCSFTCRVRGGIDVVVINEAELPRERGYLDVVLHVGKEKPSEHIVNITQLCVSVASSLRDISGRTGF
jgi:hypothetical protein